WLKANPENVTFGTGGLASPPHIAGLSLQAVTGNKFQFIPFRGSAPALQQVIGGQLDIIIDQASSALSIVKGGNVRAYAVTAQQRLSSAPDIPTVDMRPVCPDSMFRSGKACGLRKAHRRT